jgi:hypothetical protein
MCVGEGGVRPSREAALTRKGGNLRSGMSVVGEVEKEESTGRDTEGNLAPVIGRWAEACFPVKSRTSETELRELLKEAVDAARENYGPEAAIDWAGGYTFPPEYITNDVACLHAAQGDFQAMVQTCLAALSSSRLNTERVSRLRGDNPELRLMHDLVEGMQVHLPDGFYTNGMLERSARRPIYETVATAVNKMLGAIVEQKLAFLLLLDLAQQHVPNLHLCKAHWTVSPLDDHWAI